MNLDWSTSCLATAATTATTAMQAACSTNGTSAELSAVTARLATTTFSAEPSDALYSVSSHHISAMGASRSATCRVPYSLILSMHPRLYSPDSIIGQALSQLAKNWQALEVDVTNITLEFILASYEGGMDVKDFMLLAAQEAPNVFLNSMVYYPSESAIQIQYESYVPRTYATKSPSATSLSAPSVTSVSRSDVRPEQYKSYVSRTYATKTPSATSLSASSLTSVSRSDVRLDKSQPNVLLRSPNGFEVSKIYLLSADKPPEVCVLTTFLRSISMTRAILPSINRVHFIFEGITAQSDTEFMAYALSPQFVISEIQIGEIPRVVCKNRTPKSSY